jgi:hypothetical protein
MIVCFQFRSGEIRWCWSELDLFNMGYNVNNVIAVWKIKETK